MRLAITVALASSLLLTACTAPQSEPQPAPVRKKKKKKKKKKASLEKDEPVKDVGPTVMFTVKNAGLRETVLPKFEEQMGLKIRWTGPERTLSLRLTQPTPWRDALDLICQFTRTHPTTDYQGRVVLKDGWGGTLGDDVDIDELTGTKKDKPSGSATGGSSGGSSGGASGSGQGGGGVEYERGNKPGKQMWDKVGG